MKQNYHLMPYQVKYRNELNIVDEEQITVLQIADHFARNGYENLYLMKNNKISSIITCEDFLKDKRVYGLTRDFVVNPNAVKSAENISQFFIENPDVDRISVIEDGKLICEIDALVELPIQNGVAKNLMAIRYMDMFADEIKDYFCVYKRVLIVAGAEIVNIFVKRIPNVHFDRIDNIRPLIEKNLSKDYDIVLDFIYSSNIRKRLNLKIENLVSLSHLFMGFAIKKLAEHCKITETNILFYRVQTINELCCLNEAERKNAIEGVKLGKLVKDRSYIKQYEMTDSEREFIEAREYHSSLRMDNGYCFIQDECENPHLHVHKGIRQSWKGRKTQEESAKVYFFGPCIAYGFLMPDDLTISSFIQKLAEENNIKIETVNKAGIHGFNELNAVMSALETPVKRGDFLIFYDTMDDLELKLYPNASKKPAEWFNKEKSINNTWFMDFPGHCNVKGNKILARHMFEDIKSYIPPKYEKFESTESCSYVMDMFDRYKYLEITHSACIKFYRMYQERLFDSIKYSVIGAVVISEKFTLNEINRILENAVQKCDALYVFKFNLNTEKILEDSYLFEFPDMIINTIPVKVMQLEYFFYANRYLDGKTCKKDCEEEYLFVERAFIRTIFNRLHISKRILASKDDVNWDLIQMIYQEEKIQVVCL